MMNVLSAERRGARTPSEDDILFIKTKSASEERTFYFEEVDRNTIRLTGEGESVGNERKHRKGAVKYCIRKLEYDKVLAESGVKMAELQII